MSDLPQEPWLLGTQPTIGLRRGLSSVSMPRFLRIVLPLAAVFVLVFVLEYRVEIGAERARFLTQEEAIIERGVRRIEREIETVASDLLFVADLVGSSIDGGAPPGLAALERSLLVLLQRRPDYVGVGFADAAGRERLWVENGPDGARVLRDPPAAGRPGRGWLGETGGLAVGEIFVSPMELRLEAGSIAEPHVPVVHLATPVPGAAGEPLGSVVLAAGGRGFLRAFAKSTDARGVQRMILNADGYWLRHRPEAEWGFLLEHGRGFQHDFPEVWQELRASGRGRIESADGLFLFDAVSPRVASSGSATTGVEAGSWILVSLVPETLLDEIAVRAATRLLVIATPLLFLLLVVGLLLAGVAERRRLADEAVRRLEEVRAVMMTAALDAIVVMDEEGRVLEFNPAAQRIFGYTLEEARGRLVADLIIPQAQRESHRIGLQRFLATGEARIIDKHIDDMTGTRKGGEEFPVELTVCTITLSGKRVFFGFLRDLSEYESDEAGRTTAAEAHASELV